MHIAVGTAASTNHTAIRYVLLGGFLAGLADFIYPTVRTVMSGPAVDPALEGCRQRLVRASCA